jgi:hypothetical protein
MANNSTNIKNPKESLSKRDGQQFLQYQQNQKKVYQREMVNNSTNIKKPKESFSCDSQQFLQYQQTTKSFKSDGQ